MNGWQTTLTRYKHYSIAALLVKKPFFKAVRLDRLKSKSYRGDQKEGRAVFNNVQIIKSDSG